VITVWKGNSAMGLFALRSSVCPAIAGAILTLGACQRPAQLLPPPPKFVRKVPEVLRPDVRQPMEDGTGLTQSSGFRPGSRADFLSQVGTDTVYFAQDSAELGDEARATLARQANWLRKYPAVRVLLEGHDDQHSSPQYAIGLGEQRAAAMKFMLTIHGVEPERIATTSFGKGQPAVNGRDEKSRASNRRGITVLIGAADPN